MEDYKIIDLFCGAGGLSMGFKQAGFKTSLAIDAWNDAVETFNHNHEERSAVCYDITKIPDQYFEYYTGKIDGVIGGPPCQGFSLANNKKFIDDPRNTLYKEFVRVVRIVKPKFFLMENVKNILSKQKGIYKKQIIEDFEELGYTVNVEVLDAQNYGVPQHRERAFFVGLKNDDFIFPKQKNYKVSAREAISDLPEILRDAEKTEYTMPPMNEYQKKMRGYSENVYNHKGTKHTEQTISIISKIKEGGNIRDLPDEYFKIRNYNDGFTRMDGSKSAKTVDTGHYSYFHYKYNRIPTVRENARIQSFPDNYEFLGSKTSQYKQVGNAVPPMLAYAIAKEIKKFL